MKSIMVVRAEAVQQTVNAFANKPFRYGRQDCAHMVAHCVKALGNEDPLKGVKEYRSRLGAVRAMRTAGVSTFEDRLDQLFPRIAPAEALPGDIVSIQSDDPQLGCLGIRLSGNDVMAFADIADQVICAFLPYHVADVAWRTA